MISILTVAAALALSQAAPVSVVVLLVSSYDQDPSWRARRHCRSTQEYLGVLEYWGRKKAARR